MVKIKIKEIPEKIKILGVVKEDNPLEEKLEGDPDFSENFSPLMISSPSNSSPSLPMSNSIQSIEDIPEIKSKENSSEQGEIKGQTYVATSQNLEKERRRYQQQRQSAQIQSSSSTLPQNRSPMQQEQFEVRRGPGTFSSSLEEDFEKKYDINNPESRKQERRKLPWEI